ncbi:hypothetical protein BJV78DRAFT_553288 [Lactifluus subvellereus]|nr:hypothetical protein BJV78DRAFT_553288 [Lactifluus subvellereus]
MVGVASNPSFLLLFVAGVISVLAFVALTFTLVFAWFHFRGRHKLEPADNEIALPTLEEGLPASDALDFSCRGPSRLGGISSLSAERAGEGSGPQRQSPAHPETDNGMPDDVQHPGSGVSQSFTYVVNLVTTEGSERVEDHTEPAEGMSNPTTLGNNDDDREQSRPLVFPPPSTMPPLPPVPPTPRGRHSISTVWSQESMWPREKMPDIPMPPLAHLPDPRTFRFSPIMVPGSPIRRSTGSLPRSVGQSDFEDY